MRKIVLDPERFIEVASKIPATAPYVDGRSAPITDVFVRARLLNRSRRFTDADGAPKVLGFSAVGDSHTCTNPLYGRGCSLGFVQAELLAVSLADWPNDPVERARTYEARCVEEILPWYKASVAQDAANRADAARTTEPAVEGDGPAHDAPAGDAPMSEVDSMRAMMRDGLLPAIRTDPVVLRAFLRMFNLLEAPDSLMKDWDVIGRVMTVYQDRDQRPPEPALGPGRAAILSAV